MTCLIDEVLDGAGMKSQLVTYFSVKDIFCIQRCDASHDIFKGDTEISYIETP